MTSASKSVMRADPAARSDVTTACPRLPLNSAAAVGPTSVTVAPASRNASSGPVSSRSSNSSSTSIATRLPDNTAVPLMSRLYSRCHNAPMNRLARERSPYLLQHAQNPVDCFPWSDEAFTRARAEDKPIFLSIGYSTCHWCHVMEHESFEHDAIAAVLNEHFVSIKVDREERPDVDAIYMQAVQMMTQHGGWPMSVFLTEEGKPFFGGTYFPAGDRGARFGFRTILLELDRVYREERQRALGSAEQIAQAVRQSLSADSPTGL